MSSIHPDIHQEKILILDFGSQYTQLIARRLRESGVYCEILPYDLNQNRAKEFAPNGIVLNRWKMLDILDPYRICYGSRAQYWVRRGFPDTNDWCHANAIAHDARDNSILVSLRTQDCIIKFDRGTGELKWILGTHDNWKPPFSFNYTEY